MDNGRNERAFCCECRVPFEDGEEMYSWEDGCVCGECFDALFNELDRYERAQLTGSRIKNYRRPYGTPTAL